MQWRLSIRIPAFLFLVVTALTAWHPVVDHDFGFHLAAGKEILSSGRILDIDHLSVAGEGRSWINRLWGYQALVYFFYQGLHFTGVSLLTSLLACATFFLLLLCVRDPKSPLFLLVFLLSLLIVQARLRTRPETISFFFLAGVFYLIERFREQRRGCDRTIFIIPLLQLLWVNMHGLFILGILLQVFLSVSWLMEKSLSGFLSFQMTHPAAQRQWTLILVILLSILASLANPFGLKGFLVPFEQYRMMGTGNFFSNITELLPLHLLLPTLWREDKLYLAFLVILYAMAAASFFRPGRGPSLYHLMVFLAFTFLAMKANRNVALLALVVAPIAGMPIAPKKAFPGKILLTESRAVSSFLLAIALSRLIGLFPGLVFLYPLGTGLYPPEKFATRPVAFMQAKHIPGPVFPTDLRDGNLLLWKGIKPVYDGRLEIFGENFFKEYHEKTITSWKNFQSALDHFQANAVLIRTFIDNRYPGIGRNIPERCRDLYEKKDWVLVYLDSSFCLFLRNSPSNQEWVRKFRIDFRKKGTLEKIMDPGKFYRPHDEKKYLMEVKRVVSTLVTFQALALAERIQTTAETVFPGQWRAPVPPARRRHP